MWFGQNYVVFVCRQIISLYLCGVICLTKCFIFSVLASFRVKFVWLNYSVLILKC